MALFNLFGKKPEESVIGIDYGSSSIKIVELYRKAGRAILKSYGEVALGPYAGAEVGRVAKLPTDKAVQAVRDVLKEANITSRKAGIAIPMKSSMVTLIKVPNVDDNQLKEIIPLEARRYIPVPITEITLDWSVAPLPEEEYEEAEEKYGAKKKITEREVMLVAIHNNFVNELGQVIKNAELNPTFFEIEMFSTARAVLNPNDSEPVAIVDMGAGATKLYIIKRGIIRESHVIARGSQDITLRISQAMGVEVAQAEQLKRNFGRNTPDHDMQITKIVDLFIEPLFNELRGVMSAYQRKDNASISKVILAGGGASLNGYMEKAKTHFESPVEMCDPFGKVEAPAVFKEVLRGVGKEFAVAVGCALRMLQEN